MPTKRKAHVQKLLRHGKAAIVNKQPYTVRLKYQSPGICQSLYGGQDPGRTNIGAAVLTEKGECVYRSKLETRNKEISKLMTERRQHRQASRRGERLARKRIAKKLGTTTDRWLNRKLPGYGDGVVRVKDIINTQARFNNRTRPEGWLTPTARQLVQTHLSEIRLIRKILPVDHWTLEVNRFAFMLMDDETVRGSDFQNGRMKGYPSIKAYVFARQEGRCACCGGPIGHYHHIVPRCLGGSNTPENIAGVCESCHGKIHTGKLALAAEGLKKKYGALSVLNQAVPFIMMGIVEMFGENRTGFCSGKQTSEMRNRLGAEKDHDLDAVCIALCGIPAMEADEAVKEKMPMRNTENSYRVLQFRRHDRQLIHSQQQRTYFLDGKAVAKNRHKAFEQKGPSLEEFAGKQPNAVCRLTVKRSTRYYKDPGRLMPGAVFKYKGERFIMSGQCHYGQYLRAEGQKTRNFPIRECKIVRHNACLVYA